MVLHDFVTPSRERLIFDASSELAGDDSSCQTSHDQIHQLNNHFFFSLVDLELPHQTPILSPGTATPAKPTNMPKQTTITRKATLQSTSPTANEKRKRTTDSDTPNPTKKSKSTPPTSSPYFKPSPATPTEDMTPQLHLIATSTITPFQKRVLTALCQVPRGHYTTYGALSKHLESSPRAVGNALRRNPFAPEVPCHRVLASGGGLGGFMGSWGRKGEEGVNDGRKLGLLEQEGVVFVGGKVRGGVWEGFV